MATYVMQSLGCEVAGINTVHFSETLNALDNIFTDQ
jgi:pyridoxal/pyridoxine/pyridoxamine kinase